MPVQLITPPASEPITLAEAKAHLRVEHEVDDDYIDALIETARAHTEQACWRAMVTQTLELVLGGFQGEDTLELGTRGRRYGGSWLDGSITSSGFLPYIELPRGNLGSVTSIKYIDTNGVEQTLSSSIYVVDTVDRPGRVRLAYNQAWPPTQCPRWDAVRIRYTVGWDFVADVWQGPTPLRQAMYLLISQMYENRSPVVIEPGNAFDALTSPYRLIRI